MFLEQRLANIESQLAGVLELLRELRATGFVPTCDVMDLVPLVREAPGQIAKHKTPDVAGERDRIRQALMAFKRAGGDPNAVLSKAGVTRLSGVTTPEIVAKIDALIDDDQ